MDDLSHLQKFYSSNGCQVSSEESTSEQEQYRTLIEDSKSKFNEEAVGKRGEDRHYISFAEPTDANAAAVIEKLRQKLITDKVNIEGTLDPLRPANGGPSYTGGTHYSTTPSISGLSWTKKIVFK